MTTVRFRSTEERIDTEHHATVYVAVAEVSEGHTITREHTWMDHYGPVPGTHYTEYTCTCGATFGTSERPHSRHADQLEHDAERRAERERRDAELLARIQASLARGEETR